ncbi:hypothetical protein EJB05_30803, partial [Eragrostis curvula]
MEPPQPAMGSINIKEYASPIAVDNRIPLPYYFRIAGSLLQQVEPYPPPEIPRWGSKLIDVLDELESLKPALQQQVAEYNRGGTVVTNNLNGTYATTREVEKHTPSLYGTQPHADSTNGLPQNSLGGRHQATLLPNVQPDRQFRKQYVHLLIICDMLCST